MYRDIKLLSLSLFIWGLEEGLFLFFQPIYLQQLGADPIQIGSILGLIRIAFGAAQISTVFISALNPRLLYPNSSIFLLLVLLLSIYSLNFIKKKNFSNK